MKTTKALLLLGALALSSLTRASTPTSTITPSNTATPTLTITITSTVTATPSPTARAGDQGRLPQWKADDWKGGMWTNGTLLSLGWFFGDKAASGIPFKKHPLSPGIVAGDAVALVAGSAGLVSKTGSVWDQGFVGFAATDQYYNYSRVVVLAHGVFDVASSISVDEGDVLVPGAGGKVTGAAAVSDPTLFTSLSFTPKVRAMEEKTITSTDYRVKVYLDPPR